MSTIWKSRTESRSRFFLKDLERDYYRLEFLVDRKNGNLKKEEEISLKAGELVGKLYDSLYKEYIEPDENSLKSLNILCVRIVFCLYAEDAGLFASKTSFGDYIKSFAVENLRAGVIALFKALDTKLEERDKYDTKLKPFPYVNGGLFRDGKIEIPNFSDGIVDVIIKHCAPFNWAEISPTIFGAVFESTLNPETRRRGGMHYTSIENIHKVIDPLFLDGLNAEFERLCKITAVKTRNAALHDFQERLGRLNFLDPACGSGNFLTETYLSLRRLENRIISILNKGEKVLGFDEIIKVLIGQFYGIEINDFAVTVAKTALWIAESQMTAETERIMGQPIDFLPLTTNAFIVEGNALRMNWSTLKAEEPGAEGTLFEGFAARSDGTSRCYDYIMGNPPFIGARLMSGEQKKDVLGVWKDAKNIGNADYVSCWYKKAADLITETGAKAALVSTNSITQGEQVSIVWKPLFESGIEIDFAYRTFRWDSEASIKAHVHCVIIGFSRKEPLKEPEKDGANNGKKKYIFLEDGKKTEAKNINAYLLDAPDVWIESRGKPLCSVNEIGIGNKPIDGGNYLFTKDEMSAFIKKEPESAKYFRSWYGSDEFINGRPRYCLWLGNLSPAELRAMPSCLERVERVRAFRLESKSAGTRKLAEKPARFHVENMPEDSYIIIPRVSSEKRRYIPMGYLPPESLASDSAHIIPGASLYDFGVLSSSVHNAWTRAVCGRLEMRYRYSKDIVYNNFPWPKATEMQKGKIEKCAKAILDARAAFPDSSLADLYDETVMPAELRRAHRENDRAVMEAYGFEAGLDESAVVAELFRLYGELSSKA